MDKPLISVIVPIYMIDRYLGICIESIIGQTYKNLEIILVDDGSKDRCPEICDLYKSKDKRIKVIHKFNGGLVSARKAGLRESNGEYISYVDGDDWIGPEFIENLYDAISSQNADIVCAGFTRELFSKSAVFSDYVGIGTFEGAELKKIWSRMISAGTYYRPGITTYVWNKLFKRSVLLTHQSEVDDRISIGEDAAVTYPALLSASRVTVTDSSDYHYRQREDSMLKQRERYSSEAQKLKYLYEYLNRWAEKTSPELHIGEQIIDYVLSIALMRSGGRIIHDDYSSFDKAFYGRDVVVFSAGTFGQQLVNRIKETKLCNIVSWIDDDYWEYRRCCLDVDPVEGINGLEYDYILIATVDSLLAEKVASRLEGLGVSREKILSMTVPGDREILLSKLLDVELIKREEDKNIKGVLSHA